MSTMSTIDDAKKWALSNLISDDTIAILLVGSWARGVGTDINDIDIIIIKEYQLVGIAHQEYSLDSSTLDVWIHDKDAIELDLTQKLEDLNRINAVSQILSFVPDAIAWCEREPYIDSLKQKVAKWEWDQSYSSYFEFEATPPSTEFLHHAYDENLKLLKVAKERLATGKPISHRRKDYPEIQDNSNEDIAKKVLELTERAYKKLGIERHWTEFSDGRKAITTGHWGNAISSFKDVLRYLVRYDLASVPEQLLDPSIWTILENMSISDEVKEALELVYS